MKKLSRALALVIALMMVITAVLVACKPDEPIVDTVTITLSRPELNIQVGESATLTATVNGSDASPVWTSSDSAVAAVDGGVVTGVSAGQATITATVGEVSATCAVTVRAAGEILTKLPKTYVDDGKNYTYNDYLTVTPSNWNELDYADNNDTAILGYIVSPFFEYDYQFEGGKFNADGSINFAGIVDGGFEVKYSAAKALKDVTSVYGKEWGLTDEQIAAGGYIWQITLREDLAWDDGTHILADDFVYTMQQQLDPDFKLTRADGWYNNAVKIHNAKNYYYQGQGTAMGVFTGTWVDEVLETGEINGQKLYIDVAGWWGVVNSEEEILEHGGIVSGGALYMPINEDTFLLDDETDPSEWMTTKEVVEFFIGYYGLATLLVPENEFFMVVAGSYPDELSFDEVGIFAASDYDIVLVLDQPQNYFKEDGSLSYLAAYNFGSLPLVKRDLYEACKQAPQLGSTLWTTTYNTSLETSASWGPYTLTQFQAGKQFTLSRNEYWYGYADEEYKGQYLVDQIVTEIINDAEAARLAFWKGEIDGLGIDVTIAADYRNSDYAVYTPGSGTFGIQLYGNLDVLKNSGRNNGILAIREFRGALSLALDRADYNATLYTAHQPCLGTMGPVYYYDVENGLTYRNSEQGMAALLRTYGFELNADGKWTDGQVVYADIDDAYDAMTGYNLTKAKEWLEIAYKELTDNAEKYGYDASKKIQFKFGTSADNESSRRQFNYFVNWFKNLTDGTSLEGQIELVFDASFGDDWADAFKAGEYEFAAGTGFRGAAFDPFYMIGSNLNTDSLSYHTYWATDKELLTITLPAGDYEHAGETLTLAVLEWYNNLNGNTTAEQFSANWGVSSGTPVEARLTILAALEEYALTQYYFVATTSQYSASLHSAKWSYASDTYNTMMDFGGLQYMQFNYTDEEWAAFVQSQNGDLSDFYKSAN